MQRIPGHTSLDLGEPGRKDRPVSESIAPADCRIEAGRRLAFLAREGGHHDGDSRKSSMHVCTMSAKP